MKNLAKLVINAIKTGDIGHKSGDVRNDTNNKEVGSRYLTGDGFSVSVVQTFDLETMEYSYTLKNGVNEREINADNNLAGEVQEALEDLLGL